MNERKSKESHHWNWYIIHIMLYIYYFEWILVFSATVICLVSWFGQGFQVRGQGRGLQVKLRKNQYKFLVLDVFDSWRYLCLDCLRWDCCCGGILIVIWGQPLFCVFFQLSVLVISINPICTFYHSLLW